MFMTKFTDQPFTEAEIQGKVLSLMYHNVVADGADLSELSPSATSYFVTASQFRAHLKRMQSHQVLSLSDLCSQESSSEEPEKTVLHLTFDDGWSGSFELAAELLEEYNMQATVFVTTGLIDSKWFVSRDQLKQFPNQRLQIGSHTVTHRFLMLLSNEELKAELVDSKHLLEDLCQMPIETISIPHGAIDARVREAVFDAGYSEIFTSRPGLNAFPQSTHQWRRVAIGWSTTEETLQRYLEGHLFKERLKARVLSIPKKVLGREGYHKVRSLLLGEQTEEKDMLELISEQTNN